MLCVFNEKLCLEKQKTFMEFTRSYTNDEYIIALRRRHWKHIYIFHKLCPKDYRIDTFEKNYAYRYIPFLVYNPPVHSVMKCVASTYSPFSLLYCAPLSLSSY